MLKGNNSISEIFYLSPFLLNFKYIHITEMKIINTLIQVGMFHIVLPGKTFQGIQKQISQKPKIKQMVDQIVNI